MFISGYPTHKEKIKKRPGGRAEGECFNVYIKITIVFRDTVPKSHNFGACSGFFVLKPTCAYAWWAHMHRIISVFSL